MKIDINNIPPEGLTLHEEVSPGHLDLETGPIKFNSRLKIRAEVSKITNAVTAQISLDSVASASCSRCLNEFEFAINKDLTLNYPVDQAKPIIDLGPDIREEIILDYPIKPLCKTDCKGLCPKCGKNLNEGGCNCGAT